MPILRFFYQNKNLPLHSAASGFTCNNQPPQLSIDTSLQKKRLKKRAKIAFAAPRCEICREPVDGAKYFLTAYKLKNVHEQSEQQFITVGASALVVVDLINRGVSTRGALICKKCYDKNLTQLKEKVSASILKI